MEAISHIDLVVRSFERSLPFYRELLGPLGYVHSGEIIGERGERVVYLTRHGGGGGVGLREAQSSSPPDGYDRYEVGLHHLAFNASGRALVDDRARWARERGAEVESGPKEHQYMPGYYALFLFDPDGFKLEIVHRPAETDLARRVEQLEAALARADA